MGAHCGCYMCLAVSLGKEGLLLPSELTQLWILD